MEWQIYNLDPSTDNYMKDQSIEESIIYVTKKVITELTPTSTAILSIGYPMETEEEIIESVKNRAKLAVLNYAVKQNSDEQNTEQLANINAF